MLWSYSNLCATSSWCLGSFYLCRDWVRLCLFFRCDQVYACLTRTLRLLAVMENVQKQFLPSRSDLSFSLLSLVWWSRHEAFKLSLNKTLNLEFIQEGSKVTDLESTDSKTYAKAYFYISFTFSFQLTGNMKLFKDENNVCVQHFRWPHYGKVIKDEVLSVSVYNCSKVFSNR